MKITVSDACIFIDIIKLNVTHLFFRLPIDVHTSLEVFNDLDHQQQAILSAYQVNNLLHIHNLTADQRREVLDDEYPTALSCADKSAIFLAKLLGATIISSDKPVRNFARDHAIEYHGMLWILDQLIDNGLLNPAQAAALLETLMESNLIYQLNFQLLTESVKRIKKWVRQ